MNVCDYWSIGIFDSKVVSGIFARFDLRFFLFYFYFLFIHSRSRSFDHLVKCRDFSIFRFLYSQKFLLPIEQTKCDILFLCVVLSWNSSIDIIRIFRSQMKICEKLILTVLTIFMDCLKFLFPLFYQFFLFYLSSYLFPLFFISSLLLSLLSSKNAIDRDAVMHGISDASGWIFRIVLSYC